MYVMDKVEVLHAPSSAFIKSQNRLNNQSMATMGTGSLFQNICNGTSANSRWKMQSVPEGNFVIRNTSLPAKLVDKRCAFAVPIVTNQD